MCGVDCIWGVVGVVGWNGAEGVYWAGMGWVGFEWEQGCWDRVSVGLGWDGLASDWVGLGWVGFWDAWLHQL